MLKSAAPSFGRFFIFLPHVALNFVACSFPRHAYFERDSFFCFFTFVRRLFQVERLLGLFLTNLLRKRFSFSKNILRDVVGDGSWKNETGSA